MTSTSIQAQKGRLFLLKIASGASPVNYKTVTGLRASDITINGAPVDITTKTSEGWRELLPDAGVKSVDMTGSGVYDSSNTQLLAVQAAALGGGQIIDAEIVSGAGDSFVGEFSVVTFKRTGNHNDAEMFDITLQSHGPVSYVPAS